MIHQTKSPALSTINPRRGETLSVDRTTSLLAGTLHFTSAQQQVLLYAHIHTAVDMKSRRRRPLEAAAAAAAGLLALLVLAPPTTTTGFAVGGCRGSRTRMVMSQVVDAAAIAARNEVQARELDPNMPVPKERLFGMPLSRCVRVPSSW